MVKVSVIKNGNKYTSITVKGHAMYSDFGKDIVCSAISSIVTTSINGILLLNKDSLSYLVAEGIVSIKNISEEQNTQLLIENMLNMLKQLEKSYPKNIQVK